MSDEKKDPCEWNPKEHRPAYEHEFHAQAELIVGSKGNWRLCGDCARRPEFNKFRKRVKIKHDH